MGCQVDTAVLDNTGTSTEGVPRVGSAALGVTALGQVLSPGRRAQAGERGPPTSGSRRVQFTFLGPCDGSMYIFGTL